MKKKFGKKLELSKETLHNLTLRRAIGGVGASHLAACSDACATLNPIDSGCPACTDGAGTSDFSNDASCYSNGWGTLCTSFLN